MNRAIKAALFSAFVFPGSGQIYLKRRRRGLSMMACALLGLIVIIVKAVSAAMNVFNKMQVEGKAADINAVSNLAAASSAEASYGFWALLVVIIWIVSVADAYILGEKEAVPESK